MLSILAVLLPFFLWIFIALPGLLAIARPRAAYFAVPFYLLLIAALSFHYLGFSFGGRMPAVSPAATATDAPGAAGLCRQAVAQAERGGMILDRSNPARVTVDRGLWEQLPQQARDGLTLCLDMTRPQRPGQAPVQVVETGRR